MTRKGLNNSKIKHVTMPDVTGDDKIINALCARPLAYNSAFMTQVYLWLEDTGKEACERRVAFHLPEVHEPRQKKQTGNVLKFELPQKAQDRQRQFFSIMDVADNIISRESMEPFMSLDGGNYVPYRIVSGHVFKEDKDSITYEVDEALVIYGLGRLYRWLCVPVGVLLQEAEKPDTMDDDFYHVVYMADSEDLEARHIFDYENIGGIPMSETICEDDDGTFYDLEAMLGFLLDEVIGDDYDDDDDDEDDEEDGAESEYNPFDPADAMDSIAIPCTLCVEKDSDGNKQIVLRDEDDGTHIKVFDTEDTNSPLFPVSEKRSAGFLSMLNDICDERELFLPDLFKKKGDVLFIVFTPEEYVKEISDDDGVRVETVEVHVPVDADLCFAVYTRQQWDEAKEAAGHGKEGWHL